MDYRSIGVYYPFAYINMIQDVKLRVACLKIRGNAIISIINPLLTKALKLGFDYKNINRTIYKDGKLMYMNSSDMLNFMSVKEMIDILKWFYESKGIHFEDRCSIVMTYNQK